MSNTVRWLLGLTLALGMGMPVGGSSHREAPLIIDDPLADNTDVYAFVSPDKPGTVTLIANYIPFEEPSQGPNFYRFCDDVVYRIHIDNNGNAFTNIEYEVRFTTTILNPNTFLYNTGPITSIDDPNFNVRQTATVRRTDRTGTRVLGTDLATPPVNIGPRSTPNYATVAAEGVHTLSDGSLFFAGQRDDPFFVDTGSAFDLFALRPFNPAHVIPLPAEPGVDGVGDFNVHTIALQIPKRLLTNDGSAGTDPSNSNSIIAVWASATRRSTRVLSPNGDKPTMSGPSVQVSRLAHPLVNEVVIPLAKKDRYNASDPTDDAQFAGFVLDPEPARLIKQLYPGVTVPPPPRNDLFMIFLTGIPGVNRPGHVTPSEMLRLNMGFAPSATPNRLGLLAGQKDGFPNGRRLIDDVTDIELRALAGGTPFTPAFNHAPNNVLGDGVNVNDKRFLSEFPYVARPWRGYDHTHHRVGTTTTEP